ncbi:LysR family transcriptional regulator [Pseudophaeobacter sp. TrK17]|uniref:LysR family transcriptional regulator n=1 Tax=Pseudophaeobacter sp. TrK17 TaxID=2815167 RepID=UPI0035D00390
MHLEKLDLNLLVAIDALSRTQSVTAAAAELNLTQSAVSSALNRARAHFQDELFYYDGQKMRHSPFGQSIADVVPDLINRLRSLSRMRASAELHTLERQFTVIASDYVAMVFLSVLSKRLSICAPKVSLAVVPFSEEAMGNFQRGKVDFLVAPDFWIDYTLHRAPLFKDGFQCVVCKDNPLAQTGLSLQSYLDAPHVVTNFFVGDGKSHFENWLKQEDIDIRIAASLPSFVVLPYYISGTRNIATIHKRLLKQFGKLDDLTALAPPREVPDLTEYLIWKDHHQYDPQATLIREMMLETGGDL